MVHFTMNQLHCWTSSLGLLFCLTVCTCRATTIYGFEGQDVTLPCKYDSRYHGVCDICWMRGSIPNNGCGAQILYANEKEVVTRNTWRYQLYGALQKGDASLTIHKARKSDSGNYGCRVHVPGWFNDKKIMVFLNIREAPKPTSTTLGYVTTTTHIPTYAPVLTTQEETTTIPDIVTTKHTDIQKTTITLGTPTTVTHTVTHRSLFTTQEETTTIPDHVTTEQKEKQQTTVDYSPSTILTQGTVLTTEDETSSSSKHVIIRYTAPVLTTQEETTTIPDHVTTKHTDIQKTTITLGTPTTVTHTVTHRSLFTKQEERTTIPDHVTTEQKETQQTSSTLGYVTTTTNTVTHENYPDDFSSEDDKLVSENDMNSDVLPAILVPVILIFLVVGIFTVYLISKHKRRLMETLELGKTPSSSVSYSNMDSNVTLLITNSSNN